MRSTDADKAYRLIKERIITTKMLPGSVIREAELMELLELGRTPIREALKQLQSENLVVVAARRGMFVSDIAITDLQKIYEVRVELEGLCVRLTTARASNSQLQQLSDVMAQYHTGNQREHSFLLSLDRQFHKLIAKATGNHFLYNEFELFYNLSLRIWYLAVDRLNPEDVDIETHFKILAAMQAKDAVLAEQYMREHIQHFHQTIRNYL